MKKKISHKISLNIEKVGHIAGKRHLISGFKDVFFPKKDIFQSAKKMSCANWASTVQERRRRFNFVLCNNVYGSPAEHVFVGYILICQTICRQKSIENSICYLGLNVNVKNGKQKSIVLFPSSSAVFLVCVCENAQLAIAA